MLFEPNTKLEICDVDLSEPKRGEVCVQLKAAGVCHTDYSVMKGLLNAPLPAILGHEGAGIVVAIGEGVSNIKVGDLGLSRYFSSKTCQVPEKILFQ